MGRGEEEEAEEGEGDEREEDTSTTEEWEGTGVHPQGRGCWRRWRNADAVTVFGRGGSAAEAGIVVGAGPAAEHFCDERMNQKSGAEEGIPTRQ